MKTLSELCDELKISKDEVLQLYSVAREIGESTDVERLYTAVYAILRRDGKLNEAAEIEKYINKTLLRKLNAFCEKCIDFKTSVKKFIFENFDLTEDQKAVFEKEYDELVKQFKNKTLTFVAYLTIAYVALQKAHIIMGVEEFAKRTRTTSVSMRYWARKLFNTQPRQWKKYKVKEIIENFVKSNEKVCIIDNVNRSSVKSYIRKKGYKIKVSVKDNKIILMKI
ncbi:MAG: hypothetical protein QXG39_10490 [Candidatus Aenigmatarchaeota archaeon]